MTWEGIGGGRRRMLTLRCSACGHTPSLELPKGRHA
jgi:hypothetical protein